MATKYVVTSPFDGHKKGDVLDTAPEGAVDANRVVPINAADAKPAAEEAQPKRL